MKKRRRLLIYLSIVAVIIGIYVLMFFPTANYIEGPGDASPISKIVNIKDHPDKHKGSFLLTSVSLAKATPFSYILTKFNPHYSIEKSETVTSKGQDQADYQKVQQYYMQSSINNAVYIAYKAAGQQVTRSYRGIYVLQITKGSNFKNSLQVGDVITKINNRHFDNAKGYMDYLKTYRSPKKVTVEYTRGNQVKNTTQKLSRVNGHYGLGILLTDDNKLATNIPIRVDPGNVGGPSGGLMFSLQIYEQLTNKNLRHNQIVAGTGTIDSDGNVGEIGGIDKKIIAAEHSNAKVFLAPYTKPTKEILKLEPEHKTNYQLAKQTAKKYAPNMKVIPVTSFKDAVNKLNKLN